MVTFDISIMDVWAPHDNPKALSQHFSQVFTEVYLCGNLMKCITFYYFTACFFFREMKMMTHSLGKKALFVLSLTHLIGVRWLQVPQVCTLYWNKGTLVLMGSLDFCPACLEICLTEYVEGCLQTDKQQMWIQGPLYTAASVCSTSLNRWRRKAAERADESDGVCDSGRVR